MAGFDTSDPTHAVVELKEPGAYLYVPGGTKDTDSDWLDKQIQAVKAASIHTKGTTWQGISGGDAVKNAVEGFFGDLRAGALAR